MNFEEFRKHPHAFLDGMCESHLRLLAHSAMKIHLPAGACVFHEGCSAEHFYLILGGKVALQTHSAGRSVSIQTLGAGEVLGWSWLFPPYCWHFDALVVSDADLISFPAARLRDDCEKDKAFGYALTRKIGGLLIQRLQATRLKLVQSEKPGHRRVLPIESQP